MISIIICHKNQTIFDNLSINIHNTVGIKYEIIKIDNSRNQYSIFEAYNHGYCLAKYEILLYLHEDVFFETADWGKILIKYFENIPTLGLVGVAGATIKSRAPSSWLDVPLESWVVNMKQRHVDSSKHYNKYGFKKCDRYLEVQVIDGVFMAANKNCELKFDEELRGFHQYDTNICVEAKKKGFKIIVTNEILIEHFSQGNIDINWLISADCFHSKYKRFLPLGFEDLKMSNSIEVVNYKKFIMFCLSQKQYMIAIKHWWNLIKLSPFRKNHYSILIGFLFNKA